MQLLIILRLNKAVNQKFHKNKIGSIPFEVNTTTGSTSITCPVWSKQIVP